MTDTNQEIEVLKTPLRLVRNCRNSKVDLLLKHEAKVTGNGPPDYREPDLIIEASATGASAITKETWVLDAKYKDYRLPAPGYERHEATYGSHFLADLVGVAEIKYRQWIRPQVDVSAIVHPDSGPNYSFWDPSMNKGQRPPQCAAPSPHALLAVPLRPGRFGEANVTKLMRLLLGYRLKQFSTCRRCGAAGILEKNLRTAGDSYRCEACASFWIAHWCRACKQPLLKFGQSSFHSVEPPPHSFNVHCPWCGDHFGSAGDDRIAVDSPANF